MPPRVPPEAIRVTERSTPITYCSPPRRDTPTIPEQLGTRVEARRDQVVRRRGGAEPRLARPGVSQAPPPPLLALSGRLNCHLPAAPSFGAAWSALRVVAEATATATARAGARMRTATRTAADGARVVASRAGRRASPQEGRDVAGPRPAPRPAKREAATASIVASAWSYPWDVSDKGTPGAASNPRVRHRAKILAPADGAACAGRRRVERDVIGRVAVGGVQ